jgi:phosphoribosylamine-glycine ligase
VTRIPPFRGAATRSFDHLVSSSSVMDWFCHFCTAGPEQLHNGNAAYDCRQILADLMRHKPSGLVLHSNHETLLRDLEVATALRDRGVTVVAQDRRCAILGLDKRATKAFFTWAGIPTPAGPESGSRRAADLWIVKPRWGTEGVGTRLVHSTDLRDVGIKEVAERFIAGEEYSVSAFVDANRVVTLPVVHHGRVTTDLVPAHLRPRICLPRPPSPRLEVTLLNLTQRIATLLRGRA